MEECGRFGCKSSVQKPENSNVTPYFASASPHFLVACVQIYANIKSYPVVSSHQYHGGHFGWGL